MDPHFSLTEHKSEIFLVWITAKLNKQEQVYNFTVGNMRSMLNRLKGLELSDFFVIFLYSFLLKTQQLCSIHLIPKMMTMYCFKRRFNFTENYSSSLICARKGDMTPIQCLTRIWNTEEFGAASSYFFLS